MFDKKLFESIDDDTTVLEEMPFRRLVRADELRMFEWGGFWHCMDTFKDHEELNRLWADKRAPWRLWA